MQAAALCRGPWEPNGREHQGRAHRVGRGAAYRACHWGGTDSYSRTAPHSHHAEVRGPLRPARLRATGHPSQGPRPSSTAPIP
eukprot:8401854-Pyramimonas_sp.AAC.1